MKRSVLRVLTISFILFSVTAFAQATQPSQHQHGASPTPTPKPDDAMPDMPDMPGMEHHSTHEQPMTFIGEILHHATAGTSAQPNSTDEPMIMRSRDGTIIEVSEWKSREAIDGAHKNPNVLAMWNKFFAVCDCVPLNTLAEAQEMFAGFEPIED